MAEPLVSIVLMSYNQPALLKRAFDSLNNQTYPNIEIIIADDCSIDPGNKQLIENLRVRYPEKVRAVYQQKNSGIPKNKNAGIRLALGEYITYLDGDDTYYENKISSEIETFYKNPEAGIVYSNFDIKNMQGEVLSVWASNIPAHGYIFKDVILHNFPDCHTHRYEMFKKEVLYDLNFYDESLPVYEDFDLMIRYSLKYKVAYNNYIGSSYYANPASIVSNTKGLTLLEYKISVYNKYSASMNDHRFKRAFVRRLNGLYLDKLFYLEKPDVGLLLKAFIKHPTRFYKIARIANYLIKKPKIKSFVTGMKKLLVTGSSGLVGSEVCIYFASRGYEIHGIDNNQRAIFFGPQGDTRWNQTRLQQTIKNFFHYDLDIRDRACIVEKIKDLKPDVIVHAAAQPSHDKAAEIPFDDFDTNAVGTLNILEAAKQFAPEAPFIFMSTNKVYGDAPNTIKLKELDTRWDYDDENYENGIPETFSIDQSKHSLFGASKLAADIMVQEYGRYFNMPTCCLRGGCLTGPNHSGVELHGFLSYLIKCNLEEKKYFIYGYKGKQVRDNIHSYDIACFMEAFIANPRSGEVYNLGGGKENACSVLEAFKITETLTGKAQVSEYVNKNREGDHICYYSDLRKMKSHYPSWDISISLKDTIAEVIESWKKRI